VKYYLKRYPDGGFEFSPVGVNGGERDGFEIVDELPKDIKDKMPKFGDVVDPLADIKKRLDAIEAKVK
jgi:hypothetical protein